MKDTTYDIKRKRLNTMSKNEAREEILEKYIKPKKVPFSNFKKERVKEAGTMSLNDFYLEVQQKNAIGLDWYYNGKSAHDIEMMMMKNRQLIEKKKTGN